MSTSHQHEAAIFDAAMELPPERRSDYLDQACGGDAALRRRVESLLKACESQSVFLDAPAGEIAAAGTVGLPVPEKAGETIGRYKLLEQIGEGGCGVVYVAEQAVPVRRRVALKIIKLGMDTRSVIARFEAERQALALMDHPNIAKVFDAGATEAGRPYFVMELVRGMKITEFCDEKKLCTRARLDLFIQVCQAIQHAHQKGIIHRDIKPSNILVTMNDGIAVPKVIDFGIAKATGGQRLTDKTIYTAFEQFIGTPAYMSPEQAVLTSLDIDTRSDIYALGVLLYELLTGKTPFDAKELFAIGLDEMRRTIREQEPPRPSTRLSTLPGQELSTTAHRRSLDAPKLVSELRGDLDWIVMKALEKDRARRYETANGLAADIQRHLNYEPVVACPPSRLYRFQKMARRNKLVFSAAASVVAALIIGLGISTWRFVKEREALKRAVAAERTAKAERKSAEVVLEFFRDNILAAGRPEGQAGGLGRDVTLRQAIDEAESKISTAFTNRPLVEASIRKTVGDGYRYLGEPTLAIPQLERALMLRRQLLGDENSHTLGTMDLLWHAYSDAGKFDLLISLSEEKLKLTRAKLGLNRPESLACMSDLALAYGKAGKADQAFPLFEQTLELMKANLGPDHRETITTMCNLAREYTHARKHEQAIALSQEAFQLEKARFGPVDYVTVRSMETLAGAYRKAQKLDQSIALLEDVVKVMNASLAPGHPETLERMNNLAVVYHEAGKLNQAVTLYKETFEVLKAKLGPAHRTTLLNMLSLAAAYRDAGKLDQAIPLYEEALKLAQAKLGPGDWTTRLIWKRAVHANSTLRQILTVRGDFEQLDALLPRHVEQVLPLLPSNDPEFAGELSMLALDLLHREKFIEAEPLARECLAIREKKLPDDWRTFSSRSMLGGSLLGQKKYAKAEPLLLSGYDGMIQREDKILPIGRPRLKEALQRLVQLYQATSRPEDAAKWERKLADFELEEEQRRTASTPEGRSENSSSTTNHPLK